MQCNVDSAKISGVNFDDSDSDNDDDYNINVNDSILPEVNENNAESK